MRAARALAILGLLAATACGEKVRVHLQVAVVDAGVAPASAPPPAPTER